MTILTPPALVVPAAPPPLVVPNVGADLSMYIDKYVKLRAKKQSIQDEHKKQLEPYNKALDLLEAGFLAHLNGSNTDNASATGVGTVYKKVRQSATIADQAEFRRFVIGSEAWDLVDWRANAPQVAGFINENGGVLPPGVNYSQHVDVGVRKA